MSASALYGLWGITAPLHHTVRGVSRSTWQVEGCNAWLTECRPGEEESFHREARLIEDLAQRLRPELRLAVPTLIPSISGEPVGIHQERLWRLVTHLDGTHPAMDDERTYDFLFDALRRLHEALREVSTPAPSLLAQIHQRLAAEQPASLAPAAQWLRTRIEPLALLPAQVIHGDWTPLNVLQSTNGVVGVLDFEAAAYGPAVFDYANICSTMLMWSGFEDATQRTQALVARVEQLLSIPRGTVEICIVAHWFDLCWRWRSDHSHHQRLLKRLQTALTFAARRDALPLLRTPHSPAVS